MCTRFTQRLTAYCVVHNLHRGEAQPLLRAQAVASEARAEQDQQRVDEEHGHADVHLRW